MKKLFLVMAVAFCFAVVFPVSVFAETGAGETKTWNSAYELPKSCSQYDTIQIPTFKIENPAAEINHYVLSIPGFYSLTENSIDSYYTWTDEDDPGYIELLAHTAGEYTLQAGYSTDESNDNLQAEETFTLTINAKEDESEYWDHWEQDDWVSEDHNGQLKAAVGVLAPGEGEDESTSMTYITGAGDKIYGEEASNTRFTAAWSTVPYNFKDNKTLTFRLRVTSLGGYGDRDTRNLFRIMLSGSDSGAGIDLYRPATPDYHSDLAAGWIPAANTNAVISLEFTTPQFNLETAEDSVAMFVRSKPFGQLYTYSTDIDTRSTDAEVIAQKEEARRPFSGGIGLPDFEQGDALDFAEKYNGGEWIDVSFSYYEGEFGNNYYLVTLDNLKFSISTTVMANLGNYENAYLGFGLFELGGHASSMKIEVADIKNEAAPVALTTPVLSLDETNQKVSWSAVDGAKEYEITVSKGDETVVQTTIADTEYDLSGITESGEYNISIKAMPEDGGNLLASDPAEILYIVENNGGCSSAIVGGSGLIVCAVALAAGIGFAVKRRKQG